jgi:BASS family bile acid:Na+ symporter
LPAHQRQTSIIESATHIIHRFFLPLLIGSYLCAAFVPQFGLSLRQINFGSVTLPGMGQTQMSLSLVMLSFLLFNAGLGIQAKELLSLGKKPQVLIAGFFANMLVPIALMLVLRCMMGMWHNQDEVRNLLVGMALIIAMPIAGSSTAWSQNANGNVSLSLGLVMLSTILSPLTTPLIFHLFGFMTTGDYAEDLHEMAQQGTNAFLCLTVVLPSLLGMALRFLLGEGITSRLRPLLKLCNFVVLLLLNYSNASTSLPQVLRLPDWDYLGIILATTIAVCGVAFLAGWLVSKVFKTNKADKASLMFSLGMNNNGTGLVLAAAALFDHPQVMLPMIFYTLVQQIIAAVIDRYVFKPA